MTIPKNLMLFSTLFRPSSSIPCRTAHVNSAKSFGHITPINPKIKSLLSFEFPIICYQPPGLAEMVPTSSMVWMKKSLGSKFNVIVVNVVS